MGHTVYLPTYPPIKRYNYDILLLNHVSLKIYFCFFMFVYRCVFMVVCVLTHILKNVQYVQYLIEKSPSKSSLIQIIIISLNCTSMG